MNTWTSDLHHEFSYYAFGKWLYYPERVACIRNGHFREVMPVTVQVIPSLHCNFRCPRCSYGQSKETIKRLGDSKAMLTDSSTINMILDQLGEAGIKGVVFTGGGEPTLYPHLIECMHYAVQRGLKIGLFTNGSLLTPAKIHELLELNPAFIRFSLDAGTPVIHRLLHGYSDQYNYLRSVLENLETLAKGKLLRKVNTTIGVGVSVEPINLSDLVEVAKRLREIVFQFPHGGIDYLVFRPTVNFLCGKYFKAAQPILDYLKEQDSEYYESYQSYIHGGKQFPAALFETASQVITEKVAPLLKDTGIEVINIHTKMVGITQSNHPFRKCRASPWHIFVGPDGTVYNCVDLGLDSRVAIGNLLNQSLAEIWRSDRRQEVMDFIDKEGLHTLCPPICINYELNNLFERLDQAFQEGGRQRDQALEWIDKQESHVQAETAFNIYSQRHHEFI